MTDLCGPLQTELGANILTESGLPIYTECFVPAVETPTPEEEAPSSGRHGRNRFRKIRARRHGAPVFKFVSTLTEDNF